MENPPFNGCISYWTRGFAIAILVFGGYLFSQDLPVFLKFGQRWAWIWKMVTRMMEVMVDSEWWTASHRISLRTSISGRNGTTYVSIWIYPKIITKFQCFSSMITAQFRDSRAVGSIFFVCQKNRSSSSNFQDEELHQICIKPSWTIGQVKHLGQQRLALKPRGFASSDFGNMYRIYSILVLSAGFRFPSSEVP